jgi:hypothetical protein
MTETTERWNGEMPPRMAELPTDKVGRPVPWFVAWIDGVPDFRVIGPGKIHDALRCSLCWTCGRGFRPGEDRAWVIGPMCLVNLVSAEPPSHLDCATFSSRNCPFLTTPNMTRRDRHMPEDAEHPAGIMIRRNPGVALVLVTGYRDWRAETEGRGFLFRLGTPKRALWYAEGRDATRAEVLASIDSGLPLLRELAEQGGPHAVTELERMHRTALAHVPAEAP